MGNTVFSKFPYQLYYYLYADVINTARPLAFYSRFIHLFTLLKIYAY